MDGGRNGGGVREAEARVAAAEKVVVAMARAATEDAAMAMAMAATVEVRVAERVVERVAGLAVARMAVMQAATAEAVGEGTVAEGGGWLGRYRPVGQRQSAAPHLQWRPS